MPTHEGNLYRSVHSGCFSRKLVGYAILDHMRERLIIDNLYFALQNENPKPGRIVHTNQGAQYTGYRF